MTAEPCPACGQPRCNPYKSALNADGLAPLLERRWGAVAQTLRQAQQPMSVTELALATRAPQGTIRPLLSEAHRRRLVTRTRGGRRTWHWQWAETATEPP